MLPDNETLMMLSAKEKDKEFLPNFVDFNSFKATFEIWTSDPAKVGDYVIEITAKFDEYPDWPQFTYDIELTVINTEFGFEFNVEEQAISELE